MTPKSSLGKTNKYSGLVKGVQGANKPPEEPRITPEQVVAAFKSFGFTPNERNHNDIGFWTTKGRSEGSKLIAELSKRRKDIIQREDDDRKVSDLRLKSQQDILNKHEETQSKLLSQQNEGKIAMPRLSDNDINALFDEYGLPSPDPEWARSHLPNDPIKVRSILEMQRKSADDMMKKNAKNSVNSIPEVPKMSGASVQPSQIPQTAQLMGQGGPSPMGQQGAMLPGDVSAKPFFIGDHAVVRMANPNNPRSTTTWLVDVKKKVLRPILSDKAFQNMFEDPEEAERNVINISSRDLGKGGLLEGFTPLQGTKGVKHDGTMDKIEFSPAQLQRRYGKKSDPAAENKSLSMLDGIFSSFNKPQEGETQQ